jgi:aspartyl-tRNA(Asn)/glutamyl-tRNA(Gln) amidotransferase subunit A
MVTDLPFESLSELSRLLAAGQVSSVEIVDACLARIAALDDRLHAFIDVYGDEAHAMGLAADRERRAGAARGPLHGLPIALKDLLYFAGHQTTAGAKSWLGRRSDVTATVVSRLLAAGMIPLGKTHMVEFAFGGWGRNEPMGAPWNPWDAHVHRVAGGSSSGSAVAVAAGLAPVAIGSDTGGSVRIPAALCGLTGLKTTYGLISLAGVVPLSPTLDSIGPLARTAADAALVTAAIAGPDALDPRTQSAPRFDLAAAMDDDVDLRDLRVTALATDEFPSIVCADVLAARDEFVALLRDLGARVTDARIPVDLSDVMVKNGRIIAAEAYAFHRAYIEDPALPIDPWVRKRTLAGKAVGTTEHMDLLEARRRAAAEFATWMPERDVLLTPTLPITALPVADVDESTTPLATFTRAANYLGACALSLPAGLSSGGLPIGMQLIGAPFADALLLRIGRGVQRRTSWHLRRPDLSAWAS